MVADSNFPPGRHFYSVDTVDNVPPPSGHDEPAPIVRDHHWEGLTESPEAALTAAGLAWRARYGDADSELTFTLAIGPDVCPRCSGRGRVGDLDCIECGRTGIRTSSR
jgi:hypothetical protein